MCYNTSGTDKLHSGNAVPDADFTASLEKERNNNKKKATDIRKQKLTTEESSCK